MDTSNEPECKSPERKYTSLYQLLNKKMSWKNLSKATTST